MWLFMLLCLTCLAAVVSANTKRSFETDLTGGAVFLFGAVLLGILTRASGRYVRIPYTVTLLVSTALCSLLFVLFSAHTDQS